MEMLVKLTEFDHPRRLGGGAPPAPIMNTQGAITCTPDGLDTVMTWDWKVQSR
jgi:hypothetical protein